MALPTVNLGDAVLYDREVALPLYQPDAAVPATAPNGIAYVGDGGESQGMNEQEGNQKFVDTLWQINVVGHESAQRGARRDGRPRISTARIELIESEDDGGRPRSY